MKTNWGSVLIFLGWMLILISSVFMFWVSNEKQKKIDKYEEALDSCQVEFTMEGKEYIFSCRKNLFELFLEQEVEIKEKK